AESLLRLAEIRINQNRSAESGKLGKRALEILEHVNVARHDRIADCLHLLGQVAFEEERYEEAAKLYERALGEAARALPLDHPEFGSILFSIVSAYIKLRRFPEAQEALSRSLQIRETRLSSRSDMIAATIATAGNLHRAQKHL